MQNREYVWVSLAASSISVALWLAGAWEPLEQFGYRSLFTSRPPIRWDQRISVIAIDQTSLQKYGFPLPRDRYAQLLQALKNSPPAAIGFDILFLAPNPKDQEFAAAIAQSGQVVLASPGDGKQPLEILKKAAANTGQVIHDKDSDGISREATLLVNQEPALALSMIQTAKISLPIPIANLPLHSGSSTPALQRQNLWINWPGKMQSVPTYRFADIVAGKFPVEAFRDKLVLVGFLAPGLDELKSPFQQIGGLYLHAALIDNLLNNRFLERPSSLISVLLLVAIALLTSSFHLKQGIKGRLILALLLPLGWFAIALGAFTWAGWWLPIAAPIGTMLLVGSGFLLIEQYEKQQLMRLFAKQVAPEMAELMWARKTEIFQNGELPPQELVATVLFMDIRSFTTISEGMRPRDLLIWLNEYFEEMAACIMDHGGVIDKYIGDAIMAVFGIPFPHTKPEDIKQDVANAIAACLAIHERLKPLNERLKTENKPQIRIGTGMHTGPLVAGSLGGSRRANYSVIGDTVNVAARLEPMNKQFGENNPYNLLCSGDTYEYVRDRYRGLQVGEIQLRGKQTPTLIYSILGIQTTSTS